MKSFLGLIVLLSSALTVAAEPVDQIADRIFTLCNQARQQAGVSPVLSDDRLTTAALRHSQEMDRLNYFGHKSPTPDTATLQNRLVLAGSYGLSNGENLHRTQGYSLSKVAEETVKSWLESPHHRKNLLNPRFNRMGLGISQKGDQVTITQDFAYAAVEVIDKDAKPAGRGYHLTAHCKVNAGTPNGAILYDGKRYTNWTADAQGEFRVELEVPGPGVVSIGQADGERSWVIETEFSVQ